jgi:Spy/CpxP family protein refolding chaperone
MKTFLCALGCVLALASGSAVEAQDKAVPQFTSAEWLAKIQTDRRGIVARTMDLTPEEKKKFWPLYEQFERELAVPQASLTRAVLDYIASEGTLTDANAKRITEQMLAAVRDEARLHDKHYRQLLKVLPARKASRYMQIENKMQAVVRYESAKAIPLMQ